MFSRFKEEKSFPHLHPYASFWSSLCFPSFNLQYHVSHALSPSFYPCSLILNLLTHLSLPSFSCVPSSHPFSFPMLVSFCSSGQHRHRKFVDKPGFELQIICLPAWLPCSACLQPQGQIGLNPIFRLQPETILFPSWILFPWPQSKTFHIILPFGSTNQSAPVLLLKTN